MKLTTKVPALMLGSVCATAVIAGGFAIRSTATAVRAQSLDAHRGSVAAYVSAAEAHLDTARALLTGPALDDDLVGLWSNKIGDPFLPGAPRDAAAKVRQQARALVDTTDVFDHVALLNLAGDVLLLEPYDLQARADPGGWASFRWMQRLRAGEPAVVSDLHISPVSHQPSVVVAIPVTDAAGIRVGALAGSLRLDTLSALGDVSPEAHRLSNYGFLTDANGLVIAHQSMPEYARYQTDFSSVPAVAWALAGKTGAGEWRNPVDGELKLGAYRPLPMSGWTAVYSTRKVDALAPARRLAWTVGIAASGLIVVLGLGCVIVARRVLLPIRRLGSAAEKIGEGDLSQRVDSIGGEELGALARRFNEMAAALEEKDAALRGRAQALEHANAELEAFTYSVSHDLRAPLRSIDGFSKILSEDYADELDARAQSYVARVRAASQRMGVLIDDLLSLSRLSRAEIRRRRLDLSGMAERIIASLREADQGRAVSVDIRPNLVADGDEGLVEVALSNLLGNAWKFTATTAGACIEVGAEPSGHGFFVRDNGVGFDMNYVDKLFMPFERLHATAEFPGTGIGLAIVRRIARRHGGDVRAHGRIDHGATFIFTLAADADGVPAPDSGVARPMGVTV